MTWNSAVRKLLDFLARWTQWPWLALASGLALTAIATWLAISSGQTQLAAARAMAIDQDLARLETRMESYLALLRASRAFVRVEDDSLDRERFRRFISALNIPTQYPGIQGIGYSPRVDTRNIRAFEAEAWRRGAQGLKFYPEGRREWAFSILYLEPLDERNRVALGYDMHSEPVRAAAMDRARDTGGYAMSGSVVLKQEIEPDKSAGFLIYTPVFTNGQMPVDVAERRERLIGYVYAPFRAADFFKGLFRGDSVAPLGAIYAGDAPNPERLLFGTVLTNKATVASRQVEFGGQMWTLQFVPAHSSAAGAWAPYAVAVVGLTISLLLFLLARAQTRARQRAEAQKALMEQQVQFAELLVGIVSHDLRNPLNVIMLNASLLERAGLGEEFQPCVERIQSASKLSLRLIRDLLDFTQARLGGGIRVTRTPGDIHAVVKAAAHAVQAMHPGRTILIEAEGEGSGSWDSDRLTQVVSNLLMNAVVYGSPDGPIIVRSLGRIDSVEICVHNTGEPIPDDVMQVLFEPLQQGAVEASGRERNIGLGLYIVQQIALAHGGSVRCKSSRKAGTTFIVELPRDKS